jgi:anti-sigma factor RsiW
MGCDEIRDRLEEYRRDALPPDAAAAVRAHLEGCAACRQALAETGAVAAWIAGLPRPPAPDALRRQLRAPAAPARRGLRRWLAHPAVVALATAAVVLLAVSPWLRVRPDPSAELVERLVQWGVNEHRRILLQIEATPVEVGDPAQVFARVRAVTDVPLPAVLAGAGDLRLLAVRPTALWDRKAAAATLRYPQSPGITYFVLPGRGLPVPADKVRVQIEEYKPYMRQVAEFHVVYWKQGDLAYLMVSGLDDPHTRQLFLKMRKAL